MIELHQELDRVQITLKCITIGSDLCITITGGDKPHIGAVALGCVHSSISNPEEWSASVSLMTVLGHKEDMLVYKAADQLASTLGSNVVVCCGIHLEEIEASEISKTLIIVDDLIHELIRQINDKAPD
jgi:hypothetical protein